MLGYNCDYIPLVARNRLGEISRREGRELARWSDDSVSSPLHIERSVRISRTRQSVSLRGKVYATSPGLFMNGREGQGRCVWCALGLQDFNGEADGFSHHDRGECCPLDLPC